MYLNHISIKNFRLFKNLDLHLNQGLNILVGENNSGKTALIDAIRYTLGSSTSDRAYICETDFYEGEVFFSIQLKFSDVDLHAYRFVEHLSHEKYDHQGEEKYRSVLYIQLSVKKTDIERRGYPLIKTEIRSGENGKGPLIETEIRDFLATTYLKPLRDATAELSAGRASRLSQILSSSRNIRDDMDNILSIVAKANKDLLAENEPLRKSAENIQNNYLHELIFEEAKLELGAFIDIAGVKFDDVATLPDNIKRRHLRAILEGLSLALTQDRRLHGLGYHNLLFMAAELLLLEQESNNEFPLLLIEEPEAHLHPQLQMKLLQFINSRVKSDVNPEGIQCILTTHSPNLASKADPAEIIMLGGGHAWSLRPSETELKISDYKFLQKFLDATKANVFFAKGILFVEGDGENILLPMLAKLLGRPLENYGVSVVKYDNNGSWKRFVKLFLRKDGIYPPVKICVLRDLDLWPDCSEDNGINLYGFKIPNKRNQKYWRKNCGDEEQRINDHKDGLERQNTLIKISNDWTLEYCLAKFGLFEECYEAANGSRDNLADIVGTIDEKATYIQGKASKTDFAYDLAEILDRQLDNNIKEAIITVDEKHKNDASAIAATIHSTKIDFAAKLKEKLPPYIVEAIEYVTAPIVLAER